MVQLITAIEPQQKNPQRVNVYLDGEFAFGLATVVAAWLKAGQELDEDRIASLKTQDEREITFQKALHFLSYRPRSSAEVRQNLSKRGTSESLIEETLRRLQSSGLVNDEDFARAWVENRNTFRPRGKPALRMELRRKGLSDEPEFRQKLSGFLARRGFSYTTLAPVVSEVWKETQTADAGSTADNEE